MDRESRLPLSILARLQCSPKQNECLDCGVKARRPWITFFGREPRFRIGASPGAGPSAMIRDSRGFMTTDPPEPPPGDQRLATNRMARAAIERACGDRLDELTSMARNYLKQYRFSSPSWGVDDAVQDTLAALCQAADAGSLPELATEDDLWRYVHTVMKRRVLLARRRFQTTRRGGAHRRVDVDLDQRTSPLRSHEEGADLRGDIKRYLEQIEDPVLRQVLIGIHEECTNAEIAAQLGVSVRTVERKREMLRDLLGELDFHRRSTRKTDPEAQP
jgi:RNA polymerase sigma factor (sigma-70 family)